VAPETRPTPPAAPKIFRKLHRQTIRPLSAEFQDFLHDAALSFSHRQGRSPVTRGRRNTGRHGEIAATDTTNGRRALLRALPFVTAGIGVLAAGCTVAQQPFPNLTEAEESLGTALAALHRAPDRFGGHKAEAVRLIEAALNEIELARRAFR
jgi:hypothetical protein